MQPASDAVDPLAAVRQRSYVRLLVLAALVGIPISAAAYWFLYLVDRMQTWVFHDLPDALGVGTRSAWWPLVPLTVAGLLVALAIKYLPGTGGHKPADGFQTGPPVLPKELPGIFFAALATLALGAVLGPEAPLIALGSGLASSVALAMRRDVPATALAVIAAAGSFAAISTLLGSPILGAFLLMEASGLGGALLDVALLPGLLAAGVGSLVFLGLDSWTGYGTFSLVIPNLPHFGTPDVAEFAWALGIGVAAALLGSAIRWLGLAAKRHIEPRVLLLTPVAGLLVGGLAGLYVVVTGKTSADVLFSGQSDLPVLLTHGAEYSAAVLVMLVACKGLAYGASLGGFRGGPVFPAMFLGAAGGMALSHLPGLPLVAGAAAGIGAMCAVMLKLPLTSVLLATLLLGSDGVAVMPLVIVAVVVAYVLATRMVRPPEPAPTDPTPASEHDEPVVARGR
ncbi:MAG TPA: chloride channel protein [Acidimicrobiia bacterium]